MVTEAFKSLLQELSASLNTNQLYPDEHDSCLLMLDETLKVQLEVDPSGQSLVIGIDLGPVVAGKYRFNVLREALKANDQSEPKTGTLAFAENTQHLILFETLPIKNLKGETVSILVIKLKEKALIWMQALSKSEVPVISDLSTSGKSGMFGL